MRPFWQSPYAPALLVALLFAVALIGPLFWKGPGQDQLALSAHAVANLNGWKQDDKAGAFAAFVRSCERHSRKPKDQPLSERIQSAALQALYGTWEDWQPLCSQASAMGEASPESIAAFFEQNFMAVQIKSDGESTGLFTGYHEYYLRGAREQSEKYATPLLRRPDDLVTVNLGSFRPELRGENLAGRLADGRLVPYATRAEIGAEFDADNVLLWAADPVDAFFLQIQGSGRAELPDGTFVMLNYAAQNGHPYTSIGRVLIDEGALQREDVTADSIKDWLRNNPADAERIMHENASYVFFRILEDVDPDLGPPGAQDVPLSPERSLAIDLRYHALGVPIWLETDVPGDGDAHLKRLMVSQDTGGAIRGPIRGDVFWGFGPRAEAMAGDMKHQGRIYVLVPKHLAASLD